MKKSKRSVSVSELRFVKALLETPLVRVKPVRLVLALDAILCMGVIDYATGPRLSFSIFYLLPVSFIAWFDGKAYGVSLAILGAVTWLCSDLLGGIDQAHLLVPFWNALVRMTIFLVVAILLSDLKTAYESREELVEERTRELRLEIAERIDAEQMLVESSRKFKDLVENINEVYYVSDPNGKLVYGSPNLFELGGYSQHEVIGRSYVRLILPEDRRTIVDHYIRCSADGTIDTTCEFRVRLKDGRSVWVEQATRIIRNDNGSVREYRNVVRDISLRKKAEEKLREAELRFERIFADALEEKGDLGEEDEPVQKSQEGVGDLASKIDRLVNGLHGSIRQALMFSSLASHELRTPLAIIRHQLEDALNKETRAEALQRILMSVYDEVLRTSRTVEDLLNVSKLLTGKVSLKLGPVALPLLLKEFYDEALLLSREKNIAIVLARVPDVCVNVDSVKIKQVFFNLLDNSLKNTPKGGRIRIISERHNGSVAIEFSDTGCGISPSELPRIFTPFHQKANGSVSTGTGLGLLLVKTVVEAHQGKISVRSILNEGTAFTIELPAIGQPA